LLIPLRISTQGGAGFFYESLNPFHQGVPSTAFITGLTGQHGSYLTELLLSKGYNVHGLFRRSSSLADTRIDHLFGDVPGSSGRLNLHYGDMADSLTLNRVLADVRPDEVYNLAAQSR